MRVARGVAGRIAWTVLAAMLVAGAIVGVRAVTDDRERSGVEAAVERHWEALRTGRFAPIAATVAGWDRTRIDGQVERLRRDPLRAFALEEVRVGPVVEAGAVDQVTAEVVVRTWNAASSCRASTVPVRLEAAGDTWRVRERPDGRSRPLRRWADWDCDRIVTQGRPVAPFNLYACASPDGLPVVLLDWEPSLGADAYHVRRYPADSATGVLLAALHRPPDPRRPGYTDVAVPERTAAYRYEVRAVDEQLGRSSGAAQTTVGVFRADPRC